MHTQKSAAKRPHPQFPHFELVYDLPSPMIIVEDHLEAAKYFRKVATDLSEVETTLLVLMLNEYKQPIAHHQLQLGSPSYQPEPLYHLRTIGWIVAHSCASFVYLAHTMPGELYLSRNARIPDHVSSALQLISRALNTLDIELKDHLLLTPADQVSLKEKLGHSWTFFAEEKTDD